MQLLSAFQTFSTKTWQKGTTVVPFQTTNHMAVRYDMLRRYRKKTRVGFFFLGGGLNEALPSTLPALFCQRKTLYEHML